MDKARFLQELIDEIEYFHHALETKYKTSQDNNNGEFVHKTSDSTDRSNKRKLTIK